MVKVYTDSYYNPLTKECTFGLYCPYKNYTYSSHLPNNFRSSLQANIIAIERTIQIIQNRLMSSEADGTRFFIYSASVRAVNERNSESDSDDDDDYDSDDDDDNDIRICWKPWGSKGIQVAHKLSRDLINI